MKKINQKKGLSATVSMFMTLAVCHSVSVQASDIDIYSNSTGGLTRIMFVLDTSQSMLSSFNAMGCDAPNGSTIISRGTSENVPQATVNGIVVPAYTRYKCTVSDPAVETSPKTYSYTRQVVSQTTAAVAASTTLYQCDNNSSNTTSKNNCNSNKTLTSAPTSGNGIACSVPETSGNITTTYFYDRGGCDGNNNTARYRYRQVVVSPSPASTVPTNSCTSGGNISCNYEYRSCPSNAASSDNCSTVIASAPSGAPTTNESCGIGCTAYFNPAQFTSETRDVYDRFTKLKEGMFDVLLGRNGSAQLGDDIIAGLTRFGTTNATVLSTARRLDSSTSDCTGKNQRSCLVSQIAAMVANGYTPTGVAYAVGTKSLLDTIGNDTSTCNGNGVYVLTDGGPSATGLVSENTTTTAMSNAITGFSCPSAWNVDTTNTNPTFQFKSWTPPSSGTSYDNQHVWRCIAKFSDTILKGATNRAKIKTATVGFGSFYDGLDDYTKDERTKPAGTPLSSSNVDIQNILNRYDSITNNWAGTQGGSSRADIANTALWGVYGRGGWYAASE